MTYRINMSHLLLGDDDDDYHDYDDDDTLRFFDVSSFLIH